MARSQELYQQICAAVGKESLTDADIDRIILFLKRDLRQLGDAADLGIGKIVDLNSDCL